MRRPIRHTITVVFAAATALLTATGCGPSTTNDMANGDSTGDPAVLVYAAVPSQEFTNLQQSHQPVIDMLKKETGREVRFQSATDYATVIEDLREGRIHIAALGPLPYLVAKQQGAQITVVAARQDEKDQPPGYLSYGITRTGSPITSLADFRSKKICFVDRNSTSGYLYPIAELLATGIDPERDITPVFAGGHDAAVFAVVNGQCEAGFALDTIVDRQLIEQGRLQPGQITTVWMSDVIPGPPIVIADHLSPELRQRLTMAIQNNANADYLRANGFCQSECSIADGFAYGYQAAGDADYAGVREICRVVRYEPCTTG